MKAIPLIAAAALVCGTAFAHDTATDRPARKDETSQAGENVRDGAHRLGDKMRRGMHRLEDKLHAKKGTRRNDTHAMGAPGAHRNDTRAMGAPAAHRHDDADGARHDRITEAYERWKARHEKDERTAKSDHR